jgi:hypothetical protein
VLKRTAHLTVRVMSGEKSSRSAGWKLEAARRAQKAVAATGASPQEGEGVTVGQRFTRQDFGSIQQDVALALVL